MMKVVLGLRRKDAGSFVWDMAVTLDLESSLPRFCKSSRSDLRVSLQSRNSEADLTSLQNDTISSC